MKRKQQALYPINAYPQRRGKWVLPGAILLSGTLLLSACSSGTSNHSTGSSSSTDAGASGSSTETTVSTASPTSGETTSTSTAIEYAFTSQGQDAEGMVVNAIKGATTSIDLAMYNLSRGKIIDALEEAKQRGVNVRIISDQSKASTADLQPLLDAGIPIKINTFDGKMHEKLMLVDGKTALTGSFNYTKASSEENDEVIIAIHDQALVGKWVTVFDQMWNDTKRYADWTGE
ncbi:phospholipase D-like domain-containing protein [Paenibacillus kandeliae]|uniref:phospholipase D-like domain-containing protein n=1 Tax=Paenibacillus kandeliae TaxID=3231269 RepID=UPI0034579A10